MSTVSLLSSDSLKCQVKTNKHQLADSATLWRWYENWKSNEDTIVAKYGIRWFKIWVYFLASAVITSRFAIFLPSPLLSLLVLTSHPFGKQTRISLSLPNYFTQEFERLSPSQWSTFPYQFVLHSRQNSYVSSWLAHFVFVFMLSIPDSLSSVV